MENNNSYNIEDLEKLISENSDINLDDINNAQDNKSSLFDIEKEMAIDYFNKCWDLIDKKDRTHDEDMNMIYLTHASRYHWGNVGSPIEILRGEWQISHVYAILENSQMALFHALESLNICLDQGVTGFDLAFAYEAAARAYKLLDNTEKYSQYICLAKITASEIVDENDRNYTLSQLNF